MSRPVAAAAASHLATMTVGLEPGAVRIVELRPGGWLARRLAGRAAR